MADIDVIIKIPEEDFAIMKHNIAVNNPLCPLSQEEMVSKVANGTPLPKNATNGDMINALFPNAKEITVDGGYPLNYIIEGEWHRNLKEWWDKPYKTKNEE